MKSKAIRPDTRLKLILIKLLKHVLNSHHVSIKDLFQFPCSRATVVIFALPIDFSSRVSSVRLLLSICASDHILLLYASLKHNFNPLRLSLSPPSRQDIFFFLASATLIHPHFPACLPRLFSSAFAFIYPHRVAT